jgi:Xaa-Pro aminopeptidase
MNPRVERLQATLQEHELDALFVSQQENRRYLSGFMGSAGFLVIFASGAVLATDFRYTEQAKRQAPDFEVVQLKGEPAGWLGNMAVDRGLKRVGFEALDLAFSSYRRLAESTSQSSSLQLVPTEGIVESLRVTKEPSELASLTEATRLADLALEHLKEMILPGMEEREAAWEVEKFLRESGSEAIPFEPIIASGPNSALPHAIPSERRISAGEPVIVDIGARINGYCSDLSRTLYLGKQDETFRQVYDIVLGAQLTALATITAGMTGEQADSLARTVIAQGGYGDNFGHGIGHGIGLAPHEEPHLGANSAGLLSDNMVFTVEPGIYLSGWGGVRIEDTVVMEHGKVRSLTAVAKVALD